MKKIDLSMYPKPQEGFKMIKIQVPTINEPENESDRKIEVFVGKVVEVDCNHHMMAGEILSKSINGWGYDYFVVKSKGEAVSVTLKGCFDFKEKRFVHIYPTLMERYNSESPIVLYVPDNFEVRYRIWETIPEMQSGEIHVEKTKKGYLVILSGDSNTEDLKTILRTYNIQPNDEYVIEDHINGFSADLDNSTLEKLKKEIKVNAIKKNKNYIFSR